MPKVDEDDEDLEWDECCICHEHWTGLLSVGPLASFYRCSKCDRLCCEQHYDENLDMCDECAEETREEQKDEDD